MQISSAVFDFLTKLEQNNNRDWYIENKNLHESALKDVQNFVNELIERISIFDVTIRGLEAKKCFFRIQRDTRFSTDKSPYKTNFGAYMTQGGRKSNNAGYYLHIQNDMSVIAGGVWCPENQLLKKIRQEIYYAPDKLVNIIENKVFKSAFGGFIERDSLVKNPKHYPADFQYIKLLQYRHYCVEKSFTNAEVLSTEFLAKCIKNFRLLLPLINYLNEIINS